MMLVVYSALSKGRLCIILRWLQWAGLVYISHIHHSPSLPLLSPPPSYSAAASPPVNKEVVWKNWMSTSGSSQLESEAHSHPHYHYHHHHHHHHGDGVDGDSGYGDSLKSSCSLSCDCHHHSHTTPHTHTPHDANG